VGFLGVEKAVLRLRVALGMDPGVVVTETQDLGVALDGSPRLSWICVMRDELLRL
jgi:hypothetical protein